MPSKTKNSYTYTRINANDTLNPTEKLDEGNRQILDFKLCFRKKPLYIGSGKYDLWCKKDGVIKRYKCEIFYDDSEGYFEITPYNHRAMAMIGAGKYRDFETFRKVDEKSRSQQIQMTSGQTQWQNDIVVKHNSDYELQLDFFNDEPLTWLNSRWFAETWSSKTLNSYGKDVARLRACLGTAERWEELASANNGMLNFSKLEEKRKNPMYYRPIWVEDDKANILPNNVCEDSCEESAGEEFSD
jgi:hypothetical protein